MNLCIAKMYLKVDCTKISVELLAPAGSGSAKRVEAFGVGSFTFKKIHNFLF